MSYKTSHDDVVIKQPVAGANGAIVHGETLTIATWTFEPQTTLPAHEHPHEQIALVLEGTLRLTVGSETVVLTAGESAVIPGGVRHEAYAETFCRVVDAFAPRRDDLM